MVSLKVDSLVRVSRLVKFDSFQIARRAAGSLVEMSAGCATYSAEAATFINGSPLSDWQRHGWQREQLWASRSLVSARLCFMILNLHRSIVPSFHRSIVPSFHASLTSSLHFQHARLTPFGNSLSKIATSLSR